MTNADGTDAHFTVKDEEYTTAGEDVAVAVRNDIVVEAHHSRDKELFVTVGKVKFDSNQMPTEIDWHEARRVHFSCDGDDYPGDKVYYSLQWTYLSMWNSTDTKHVNLWYMPNDADTRDPQWTYQELSGVVNENDMTITWEKCATSTYTDQNTPPSRVRSSPLKNGPHSTLNIKNDHGDGKNGKVTYSVTVKPSLHGENQDEILSKSGTIVLP